MPEISPETDVRFLRGVGPKKAATLSESGIATVSDLLYSFPRTYEDRRNRLSISSLREGAPAAFTGKVLSVSQKGARFGGRKIPFIVLIGDDTGAVEAVFFNAGYMDRIFTPGRSFVFFGTPQRSRGRLQVVHPDFDAAEDDLEYSGHPIMPVYALKRGLTQKDMRRWRETALPAAALVEEYLPERMIREEKLCGISQALRDIHFPPDKDSLKQARYRLVFEELLMLQTGLLRLKLGRESGQIGEPKTAGVTVDDFASLLPFSMTGAQRRVTEEVFDDMASGRPMNRLVQGDVGSGKTAVAAAAVYMAVRSGYQAVLMAPTEILARQHYEGLSAMFGDVLSVALFTSGMTAAARREALEGIASGQTDFAVGTHALIQPDVEFHRLGLVITDEQHRFGVNQRIALAQKGVAGEQSSGGASPDVLVMTATPIPRSLAFVLYGDLDISVIDEMPPGRRRIATKAVSGAKREDVYAFVKSETEKGGQAYVVAPLIEDRDEQDGAIADMRSAESIHAELEKKFPDCYVSLLHGRMKQADKDEVMATFAAGDIDILVSTVVIEVGVNVPNATVMVIENAERFGLAQLHQLRGRVGRGRAQSYCVLVTDSQSEDAISRAELMTETDDGFRIAEMDLSMRGPGELFGVRQHGVPALRIADLAKHVRVAERTKAVARDLLADDPMLVKPENRALGDRVESLFRDVTEIGL